MKKLVVWDKLHPGMRRQRLPFCYIHKPPASGVSDDMVGCSFEEGKFPREIVRELHEKLSKTGIFPGNRLVTTFCAATPIGHTLQRKCNPRCHQKGHTRGLCMRRRSQSAATRCIHLIPSLHSLHEVQCPNSLQYECASEVKTGDIGIRAFIVNCSVLCSVSFCCNAKSL